MKAQVTYKLQRWSLVAALCITQWIDKANHTHPPTPISLQVQVIRGSGGTNYTVDFRDIAWLTPGREWTNCCTRRQ